MLIADLAAPQLRHSIEFRRLVRKPADTFNVSCDLIAGTPTPVITWLRDGHLLMTSSRADVTGSQLIVTSLQVDDGGVYTCTASNVVGEDYRVFRLVVEGESYANNINRSIVITAYITAALTACLCPR